MNSTVERADRAVFSRDWMIRYYPDSTDTHTNRLVGISRFVDIVDDEQRAERILSKIHRSMDDKVVVKLRRGIRFDFARH